MKKLDILDILEKNTEKMISGEEMARILGVSRNAVWKGINSLKRDGYRILSSPKLGYRLEDGEDVLSLTALQKYLKRSELKDHMVVFHSISSTNTYLKEQGQQGRKEPLIAVAEVQTAGRGRMQRPFYSPEKNGVYFSILLFPSMDLTQINFLTILCAIAVCDAVRETCGIEPSIKWPNDVMMNGKKLCGILTEASIEGESGQLQYVVVGAGINLSQKEEDFPSDISKKATSIFLSGGKKCTRAQLTAAVLDVFFDYYEAYLKSEKKLLLSRYRKLLIIINKEIVVHDKGSSYPAVAIDVDEDAHLLVRDMEGKEHVLQTGEISIGGIYPE